MENPFKNLPSQLVNLDAQGMGNILVGAIEMLHDASGTANFLLRGMKSMKDQGVLLIIDPAKGSDPDMEREYNDIMEILTLMRDKIPERLYTLVAINQKGIAPETGGEIKPN